MLYKDYILKAIEKSNKTNEIDNVLENDICSDTFAIAERYNEILENNNPNNYESLKANQNEIAKIVVFWNDLPLEFKAIIRMLDKSTL